MTRLIAMAAAVCLAAGDARAEPAGIWDILRMDDVVDVMSEEGRHYGDYLAEQFFEKGGGPTWDARVAGLYDADGMTSEIRPHFTGMFEGVDTGELEEFFASDLGQRIVRYEIEARRTLLDPEAEAAAAEGFEALGEQDPARRDLIRDFIEVNDLVEMNVASSLTFTYAFNLGLLDGGMEDMTEDEALSDAWAQEDTVREDTLRWLGAQLSVAFAPLSDEELGAYVEISETEAGEALNSALFRAFEPTFTRIARGLGEGVARSIGGHDI
jgi:hypothetical protein